MKKVFVFICIAFLLSSCYNQELAIKGITGYDSRLLENGDGLPITAINITKLVPDSTTVLGIPQKVIVGDDFILVQDENKLVCYDTTGRNGRIVGKYGHGKGEFIRLSSFCLNPDNTVSMLDSYKEKIVIYGLDGKFKEEKEAGNSLKYTQLMSFVNEDSMVVCNYVYNEHNKVLGIYNQNERKYNEMASTHLKSDNVMMPIGLHPYSIYKNSIKYVLPFDNKIYDAAGNCVYEFQTKKNRLKETVQDKIKDFDIMTYANVLNNGGFLGFSDIFETEHYIIAACKNIDYVLLNKQNDKCTHFDYQLKENLQKFPLLNIVTSKGNTVYGIVNSIELEKVKKFNQQNQALKKLMSYKNDKDVYLLISYTLD